MQHLSLRPLVPKVKEPQVHIYTDYKMTVPLTALCSESLQNQLIKTIRVTGTLNLLVIGCSIALLGARTHPYIVITEG